MSYKSYAYTQINELILQIDNDPCQSGPCQNNARCNLLSLSGGYYCSCQPGYTGSNCAYRICSLTCLNGGTCRNLANGIMDCACPLLYSGLNCEICNTNMRIFIFSLF